MNWDLNDFIDYSVNLAINHPIHGLMLLDLWDHQIEVAENFLLGNNKLITCSARQMGMSTLTSALLHWYAHRNSYSNVVCCSPKEAFVQENRKCFVLLNPCESYLINNKREIQLKNKSRIHFKTFTSSNFLGYSYEMAIFNDAAFYDKKSVWNNVKPSLNKYVWINSTPNGVDNWFYDMYIGQNEFYKMRLPWDKHPEKTQDWHDRFSMMYPDMAKQELEAKFL